MTPQKLKERKRKVKKILEVLHKMYPGARTELNYSTPWELLVAVQLLSEQGEEYSRCSEAARGYGRSSVETVVTAF